MNWPLISTIWHAKSVVCWHSAYHGKQQQKPQFLNVDIRWSSRYSNDRSLPDSMALLDFPGFTIQSQCGQPTHTHSQLAHIPRPNTQTQHLGLIPRPGTRMGMWIRYRYGYVCVSVAWIRAHDVPVCPPFSWVWISNFISNFDTEYHRCWKLI